MKIGVLGGTFNPIHLAHMHIARQYREYFALDRILLIPTSTPPHKKAIGLAAAHHRLEMCRLAIGDEPGFEVCDYEIERGGISYTLDTLRYLQGEYHGAQICLLMGADMFLTIQNWRKPKEIFELTILCACAREKGEYDRMLRHKPVLEEMGAKCELVDSEPTPMSSTDIRKMINDGVDVVGYLNPAVWRYICEHKLYM